MGVEILERVNLDVGRGFGYRYGALGDHSVLVSECIAVAGAVFGHTIGALISVHYHKAILQYISGGYEGFVSKI